MSPLQEVKAPRKFSKWIKQTVLPHFFWEKLLNYSSSQIVTFGSYATLAIPILVQVVIIVVSVFGMSAKDVMGGYEPTAKMLYASGLFLVLGKLLVQLFCPERIRRYPNEDDHLVYIGEVRHAQTVIKNWSQSREGEVQKLAQSADGFLGQIVKSHVEGLADTNQWWQRDNESKSKLRYAIALFFILGGIGFLSFMIWRLFGNIFNVFGL